MPVWLKMAVALIPLIAGSLVALAWQNSHSMGVQAALIARMTQDIEQLETAAGDVPAEMRKR